MTADDESEKARRSGGLMHRRSFLGGSVATAVTAASLAGGSWALASEAEPAAAASGLKAGAGKAVIEIPSSLLPLDGFTTVRDDLYVRVLLVEKIVSDAAGVETAGIVVTVTHTFSTPHVNPGSAASSPFMKQVSQAAASTAVAAAVKALQPARIGHGTGKCDVNVNRDVLTADGWWLGTGEAGTSDTVSQGDESAYPGQNAITAALEEKGATVARAVWDGTSTQKEFAADVKELVAQKASINYVAFEKGTVVPSDQEDNSLNNHLSTWKIAYNIPGIRAWIFKQHK